MACSQTLFDLISSSSSSLGIERSGMVYVPTSSSTSDSLFSSFGSSMLGVSSLRGELGLSNFFLDEQVLYQDVHRFYLQ